ncbi:MAG: hypothetical protein AAF639_40380 [Chloroflexota bacterium]
MSIIIPTNTSFFNTLSQAASEKRAVFFAGLPGVGKSLYLQQLALMAHQADRVIHLLQWDVTRTAFETPDLLAQYPEVDGVTHAAIRKAVGLWARQAVLQWHQTYQEPEHILIGEVPLIGNRLVELVKPQQDEAEELLHSDQIQFILPVPSAKVREVIEEARNKSIANPQNEREKADASPNVLQMLWRDVYRLAHELGLVAEPISALGKDAGNPIYDPAIYASVYEYLLQHRHSQTMLIDMVLPKQASVYELDIVSSELCASETEVAKIMSHIETEYSYDILDAEVQRWYEI